MARSNPRSIFGIHGVTPYSRTTGLPYGELRVLSSSSLELSSELVELRGGSAKYPWAAEEGEISADMTLNVGELPNFMFELFLGKAPTTLALDTNGDISTLTNKKGSSIQGASNAITAVSLLSGSAANLKFGKYVVEGQSTSAFNLYYLTGIDIGRGTNGSFLNDAMLVASSVTFTASVATVPGFGLSFAQDGTLAFTVGDTATFEVLPVHGSSSYVTIGGVVDQNFPEFGALVYAQKRGNQQMLELDCFRCKGAGMPIPFEMGAFQAYEVGVKCLYDETLDGLFKMRFVEPT